MSSSLELGAKIVHCPRIRKSRIHISEMFFSDAVVFFFVFLAFHYLSRLIHFIFFLFFLLLVISLKKHFRRFRLRVLFFLFCLVKNIWFLLLPKNTPRVLAVVKLMLRTRSFTSIIETWFGQKLLVPRAEAPRSRGRAGLPHDANCFFGRQTFHLVTLTESRRPSVHPVFTPSKSKRAQKCSGLRCSQLWSQI